MNQAGGGPDSVFYLRVRYFLLQVPLEVSRVLPFRKAGAAPILGLFSCLVRHPPASQIILGLLALHTLTIHCLDIYVVD